MGRVFFVTKCPPAELGRPLHPLPVEKLCFGVNPCVAAAEDPHSHVWRKKSFRCLGKPGAAESSTVCEGELGLQLNDWKQAAVLC